MPQAVFYVFVSGPDGAEHCFPVPGRPEVETVFYLQKSVQVGFQPTKGALSSKG
jgi:hypothetical protein